MTLPDLLNDRAHEILKSAFEAMQRAHARHYEEAGEAHLHQRLKALFALTVLGIKERNLGPMIAHAETIAQERFASGFDLWEVQTAFNALEEAVWRLVLKEMPVSEYGESLGLISTVLGAGKDTLARKYVSLATKAKAPTLDLSRLFSGTESGG